MKVFIENEAGSDQKNLYNEKTLEYKKTVTVSRKYPYPFGFILDTTSGDGDSLDVFIVTNKKLKSGQVVECEPIGLMEQIETSWNPSKENVAEEDHNILAVLVGEEQNIVSEEVKARLTDFVLHVFDHIRKNKSRVENFLDKEAALQYIEKCKDK